MKTLRRLWLKLILCEAEERAELQCTLDAGSPEWFKRYNRYVFTYQRHP
jgi:hypothetical protein